ncbi:tetratricopeptide repeat protein [Cohnella yongneupensis]|uniref:Tetratricopeptide repeat protein n=1 Tax=Cohnella yongneupensis TaxID=425006 RepID=A0ABW0R3I0_9BACL
MDGEVFVRQAYEAILQGDFELALHWFQQAIAAEPSNAAYYYKGSVTCARSGKLPLAMTYAQKAVELKPDDPTYKLHYRTIKAKQRITEARFRLQTALPNLDKCLDELKEATELDPLSDEAFLLLGIVYRLRRDYRQSLESLREALTLDPLNEEARRLLHEVRVERRKALKEQYSNPHSKRNR